MGMKLIVLLFIYWSAHTCFPFIYGPKSNLSNLTITSPTVINRLLIVGARRRSVVNLFRNPFPVITDQSQPFLIDQKNSHPIYRGFPKHLEPLQIGLRLRMKANKISQSAFVPVIMNGSPSAKINNTIETSSMRCCFPYLLRRTNGRNENRKFATVDTQPTNLCGARAMRLYLATHARTCRHHAIPI